MVPTKVELQSSPTPTDKIISADKAFLVEQVIDADGKVYKLKLPDALDEFDLTHALGDDSTNLGLQSMAMPLIYIKSIDDIEMKVPRTYNEIRAGIKRVGRNGMEAVMKAIKEYIMTKQANEEEAKAELKK